MSLISDAFETTKNKLIKKLRQIPDDILQELYFLDIVGLKGKLQYNLWLADRYRKYRELSPNKNWLEFKIGSWIVQMEIED
jgi:hypothetical protein